LLDSLLQEVKPGKLHELYLYLTPVIKVPKSEEWLTSW